MRNAEAVSKILRAHETQKDGGAVAIVMNPLVELVRQLPQPGRGLLVELVAFLQRVDPVGSKMTPEALGLVFAPTVLRRRTSGIECVRPCAAIDPRPTPLTCGGQPLTYGVAYRSVVLTG